MRSVSLKRAAQLREYAKLRKQFIFDHPYCEWWLAEHGLTEADVSPAGTVEWNKGFTLVTYQVPRSIEPHHKNKRFGSRLNDTSQWMAVSREGHEWIESHKSLARERGYLNNY